VRRSAIVVAALLAALAGAAASARAADGPEYDLAFDAKLDVARRAFAVTIRVSQSDGALRSVDFDRNPDRHVDWSGNGVVEVDDGRVVWEVPEGGGTLRYLFQIDHLRDERSYDARCATEWALFRGDELVPPAATRIARGTRSRARLRLRLPEGWSAATPFPTTNGRYAIESDHRSFDRPTGWILVARRLGVLRETVAGVRVAVAGPAGQGVRRHDLLALLRWNLPELRRLLPDALPERLLLVGAGDPMWRGGLSGPDSIFLHADRPLITPDGTSPLLHEVLHTVLPISAGRTEDWLVEGLAEYYALGMLARSGTLSKARHEKTLNGLAERGRGVRSVRVEQASGAITARAVTLLAELDRLIGNATEGRARLDAVVRRLVANDTPLALDALAKATEAVADEDFEDFFERPVFDLAVPEGT